MYHFLTLMNRVYSIGTLPVIVGIWVFLSIYTIMGIILIARPYTLHLMDGMMNIICFLSIIRFKM